jgi:hypothetical protein
VAQKADAATTELGSVLRQSKQVSDALAALRSVGLGNAYLAAGVLRDCYWAHRHGFAEHEANDVDVVFFDPATSADDDARIARELGKANPRLRWDVTNQAHVHTWYTKYSGVEIAAITSIGAGVSMWPETATCVAARPVDRDAIAILAPLGIDDLLDLRWRPNPRCPDPSAFARRLREKRVSVKWPRVRIDD